MTLERSDEPDDRPPLIVLDRRTRRLQPTLILGGDPPRVLRLSDRGAVLLDGLLRGTARERAAGVLARRLVADGLAHPVRPDTGTDDITVVVPVRDDASGLDACLAALAGLPVIVVDDGSADAAAIAVVAARPDVQVVWHAESRGPGGARNTGIAQVATPIVAFVDADVQISANAIRTLGRWFADETVGAVAPRVRPAPTSSTVLQRFLRSRSPLDLGPDAAAVRPQGRVSYVPSAVLLCRRSVLGSGFDEDLRYGEDVDLVWRIVDAGSTVRYDPGVVAHHREPATWMAALRRRHRYGTSAGPLAQRHGARLAPAVTTPLPALAAAFLLARRSTPAAVAAGVGVGQLARRLARAGIAPRDALGVAAAAVSGSLLALGRAATQLAPPLLLTGGPLGSVALLAVAPLAERHRRRPDLDPLRWTVACIADDVAYGLGVWRGALRTHSWRALLPVVRRYPSAGA